MPKENEAKERAARILRPERQRLAALFFPNSSPIFGDSDSGKNRAPLAGQSQRLRLQGIDESEIPDSTPSLIIANMKRTVIPEFFSLRSFSRPHILAGTGK